MKGMNIADVVEKYRHLDQMLSDPEWLQHDDDRELSADERDTARLRRIMQGILFDCWAACKGHAGTVEDLVHELEEAKRALAHPDARVYTELPSISSHPELPNVCFNFTFGQVRMSKAAALTLADTLRHHTGDNPPEIPAAKPRQPAIEEHLL